MRYHSCHDRNCKNRSQPHPCHYSGCLGHRIEFRGRAAEPAALPPAERRTLELWRKCVSEIPSTFGRLAYLAGLRNRETGRYRDPSLQLVLGEEKVDRALRETHHQVFAEWLAFSLKSQSADLNVFLSGVEGHRRQILAACAAQAPHDWLIPEGVAEHERRLYLADLEALLGLLYAEYGLSARPEPEPDLPLPEMIPET